MLLGVIVLAAGVLRFANLDGRPAGFFRDEAEKAYNSWALATTGGMVDLPAPAPGRARVQWRALPWMTNVFGTRTSTIYHYVSVPFMWTFGPTPAAARMAAALVGTLTVGAIGLLLMLAWGAGAGLAGAAWLALMPWHLVFSRWALQGIFVPLLMLGALAGCYGIERRRAWGLPVLGASLGWLFYAYSGAQPLVPAWGVCLAVVYRRRLFTAETLRSPAFWGACVLFLLPVVPTVLVRLEPGGSERMGRVAIWNDPETAGWRVPLVFMKNWLSHFDPRFLFLRGDGQPRHSIPGLGLLTWADAMLLPLGLVWAIKRRVPLAGALVAALVCAPVPAALTMEGVPHALRAIGMIVPSAAFSAFGIVCGAQWLDVALRRREGNAAHARRMVALLLAALSVLAASGAARYWRLYGGDPVVQVAFENGQRVAWEQIATARQPGERVFVNGYLPYSVYYQLFFLRIPARSIGPEGPDPEHFVYYDPERQRPEQLDLMMRPGDWLLLAVNPVDLTTAEGKPWMDEADARRVGEPWVIVERKQVNQ